MPEENFFEECWFIYGVRLGGTYFGFLKYHSKGTAGSVEFDWHKALTPLCLGWYHSHPGEKFLTPSARDDKTMRSWVKGLMKPMLCGIFCQEDQECYCYFKGPESTRRETVVRIKTIEAKLAGPFFLGSSRKNDYGHKV
jgi:hypothetical protein